MLESASNQATLVDVATWKGLPCRQTQDCCGSSEVHLAVLHNRTYWQARETWTSSMVLQSLPKTDWNVQTKCVPIQVSVRCDPKQIPKLVFKPNLNLLCGCLSHTGLKSSSWATGCNPGQAKSNQCLGFVIQLIPITISIFYVFHIYDSTSSVAA